jgi:hypothetical protein
MKKGGLPGFPAQRGGIFNKRPGVQVKSKNKDEALR